jgi:hypothetical protein
LSDELANPPLRCKVAREAETIDIMFIFFAGPDAVKARMRGARMPILLTGRPCGQKELAAI